MRAYGRDACSDLMIKETADKVKLSYIKRKRKPRISFGAFLLRQMQFAGGRIWAFQAVALTVICLMIKGIYGGRYASADPRQIAFCLGVAAVIAAMTGIPYLCRSLRYDMYEIETASRLSYSGLLLARIILAGAGNLVMLAAIFTVVYVKSLVPAGTAIVYMLAPFSAVWIGCLLIAGHSCSKRTYLYCTAFSIGFMLLLYALFKLSPQLFAREMLAAWAAVCIVMIGGLLTQIRILAKRPSGMDKVSMQLD